MPEAELNALVRELHRTTPLGRLALDEADAVFAKLTELGYVITKPPQPAAGA
jgi:hypothetical protein